MNFNITTDSPKAVPDMSFIHENMKEYKYCLSSSKVKLENFPKMMEKIELKFKKNEHFVFESGVYFKKVLKNEMFLLDLEYSKTQEYYDITPYGISLEALEDISKILKEFEDIATNSEISINYFFYAPQGLLRNTTYKDLDDFMTSTPEYYPYLDIEEMFNQFLLSDNSILLICGIPGTGKSKLADLYMKFLLLSPLLCEKNNIMDPRDINVAYVKNEKILSDDVFWSDLTTDNYELVFLDDLDYSLLPRTQDISSQEDVNKNKFISHFLSFTDGIFSQNKNTKFIITTNKEVSEIDTAILRKGRTFDILNLRSLKQSEAQNIWKIEGLELSDYNSAFGDKENILACDLGSEITELKASLKYNRGRHPYILEDNISIYNSSTKKQEKKMGFTSNKGK